MLSQRGRFSGLLLWNRLQSYTAYRLHYRFHRGHKTTFADKKNRWKSQKFRPVHTVPLSAEKGFVAGQGGSRCQQFRKAAVWLCKLENQRLVVLCSYANLRGIYCSLHDFSGIQQAGERFSIGERVSAKNIR